MITESVCNLVVLPQRHYKTLCVCYYQSVLWRQCVLMLCGFRVWFKHWNLKQCSVGYSRNRFNGHCMRQVARSTCSSSLLLCRYIWVLIKHYTTAWWPTSHFMVAGTSYTHHSQLFRKICGTKCCKRAKK